MAGAFFIIPQSAVEYCGIAFSLLYCMGVLQNSTTVELCGMSRFFCKTALIVGGFFNAHQFFTVVALYPDLPQHNNQKFRKLRILYKRNMLVTHVTFFGHA